MLVYLASYWSKYKHSSTTSQKKEENDIIYIDETKKDEFINEYNIVSDLKFNTNFISMKQKHQLQNYWRDHEAIIQEKGTGYLR